MTELHTRALATRIQFTFEEDDGREQAFAFDILS